ncbi:MAG: sigma-70 family RNA polymerase sigma factor [Oscillospiraceae bacterium]|nr:sigma-70 family RNA polymerase sigma factor [Oscillospiraceae bacterium]
MSRGGSEVNISDFNKLGGLDDNELVKIAQDESDAKMGRNAMSVLMSRYLRLVRKKAYAFSCENAEPEDLAQEGLLAFMNAVASFDVSRGAKFSSFANVCITNGIRSAVMKLNRNKGEALPEDIGEQAEDVLTPENIWFEKEKISGLYDEIALLLSKKEWSIFRLYLDGLSYNEIASRLDIPCKSVDNAVFRVKKKLRAFLSREKLSE